MPGNNSRYTLSYNLLMVRYLIKSNYLVSELFDKIDKVVIMMCNPSKNQVDITSQWRKCMNILEKFEEAFSTFKTSGSAESNLFAY